MNNDNTVPVIKDLVLIGGGHSHLSVLKYFAMHPVPGLRLTLITRDLHTPYSGMLPGYIAGHYSYDQAHIDLRPLAQFAKARIYHAEVNDIDLKNKLILCKDRPAISYDIASINIGSKPGTLQIPGAEQYTLPVKPIDRFLTQWEVLTESVIDAADKDFNLAIVVLNLLSMQQIKTLTLPSSVVVPAVSRWHLQHSFAYVIFSLKKICQTNF